MPVFPGKYLSDEEIWLRINDIIKNRNEISKLLASPEISTDPSKIPALARQLHELEQTCLVIDKVKECMIDLHDLEEMIKENKMADDDELQMFHKTYSEQFNNIAQQLYHLLLEKGYIDEEKEDERDLIILKFIEYAGPEYAWRLGINIGIDVAEARKRLDMLLEKGLLEKVQGTMLDNYHREKDWTKHMNHTYYRISREGKLYLRKFRKRNIPTD